MKENDNGNGAASDRRSSQLAQSADLVRDFSRAIERDELTLLFQPIVRLASGQIAGVEALVRWDHPTLGRLGAKAVLEAADAAGMAIQLGNHIRAKAMRDAMAWPPELATLYLSLNATAADLGHASFLEELTSAKALSGFPAERLVLEITEDAVIADTDSTALVLEQLNRKGILVYIDDFGSGYSSLGLIAKLPIFGIKLDPNFTKMLRGNERERHVVKAVATLAHTLGLSITIEGVEDPMDIAPAFSIGCDSLQGFGVSHPLPGEALPAFLASWVKRPR
jgi:EAL domain-containing protein (putative c-di-GMP-specific phosphodiesterase class I)